MKIFAVLLLSSVTAFSQAISYFNQGFLRQQNAAQDLAWLGISSSGSGSVTNFNAGNLSPLFTSSVTTPTTWPHLTFSPISQSANLFYASPDGSSGVPTFRALTAGDLPSITSIVRADVSATAPVLYDSTTGIFSMHVADVSHDGYLSSADWGTFNSKGSGTLTSVTNASLGLLGVTILSSSNPPVPAFKSISAGANVTVTDQGGTNIVITANSGGGGGASGSDLLMTNLTAYANGTNFYIDFSFPAATVLSTGDIAFNYSTNWGLSSTSRVVNIFIPATNIFRKILFLGAATNWHQHTFLLDGVPTGYGAKISMQLFGMGETNVTYTPLIDRAPTTTNWIAAGFNPTNSQGGCVAWWEASQQLFQDEYAQTPIIDGVNVRAWVDLANVAGKATNSATSIFNYWRSPNASPGNIPSINFVPSGVAYLVTSNFTNLPQVNWAFMMIYGRGSSLICLDGLSEGNRFACQFSESPSIPMAVYSGSSVTATPGAGQIQWRLFSFCQNGASSVIRTNGVQAVTGNSGTQTPARWTIGADYPLSTEVGNYNIAEILIYHTNMTLVQLTNVESYFRTKYKTW